MTTVSLFGLILFVALPLILLAVAFVVLIMWLMRSGGRSTHSADEARVIQEIHNGLTRMEQRVEALETLLLDAEQASQEKGNY